MAKESILKIREAEALGEKVLAEAEEKAAEILEMAEQMGKAHVEKLTLECEIENRQKLSEIRARTEEMLEESRIEAETASKQLRQIANPRMRNAVKLIVQGIIEQCQ